MGLLHTLAALLAVLAAPDDGELLKDFKRYFRKYEDTATRVEAVLALETTDCPELVQVLTPVLQDADGAVVQAAVTVLGGLRSPAAVHALVERLADARKDPVQRGLVLAVTRGRFAEAAPTLATLAREGDWELRTLSLRALVAVQGAEATDTLQACLEDDRPEIQACALDLLAELRSPRVVEPAVRLLSSEVWQVRARAMAALARVRHRDAIGPLIDRLEQEEGRLVEDAAAALEAITGLPFGLNVASWRSFWERSAERFEVPTEEQLARQRAAREASATAYVPEDRKLASFHGLETLSRSILFVIDISGSMEQEIRERTRYADKGLPSMQRMEIVKRELIRTIRELEPYVEFNILTFATEVKTWKKDLVRANPLNKSSAETFLERLEPLGGASRTHLARAGLANTANLEAGKTNTHGALMRALGDGARSGVDAEDWSLDTMFFLSDGIPSCGEYLDMGDILREVRRVNEHRGVVIHTLGIGDFEPTFLRRLAAENGGRFVDLGR